MLRHDNGITSALINISRYASSDVGPSGPVRGPPQPTEFLLLALHQQLKPRQLLLPQTLR